MKELKSSNPTFSAKYTPVNTGVFIESASTEKSSASSGNNVEFRAEGPNENSTEMIHQIKCINCSGNVTQRWYVEYYIIDEKTQVRVRKREYGYVNKEKDHDKRYVLLLNLKQEIIQRIEQSSSERNIFINADPNSITHYINEYLFESTKINDPTTVKSYTIYLTAFQKFLKTKGASHLSPNTVTKQMMYEFRDQQSAKLTNRGVNNYMDSVKGFFSFLIKKYDNVLFKNPCGSILKLASKSENHVAYTKVQAEILSTYLNENDLILLQYCRFVAYGFLRCKETRNLRVGDIDFERKTITLPASRVKSRKRTVKPMLDTLYNHLLAMKLQEFPSNYYVFTTNGEPGLKKTYDCYFQKRYALVKKKFGLSNLHTIYSFRHTFVCELLDSGASWHEIMKYTGHTTFASFEKYARSILNKPAVDLSANIKINF